MGFLGLLLLSLLLRVRVGWLELSLSLRLQVILLLSHCGEPTIELAVLD